ncbi:phosphotransferase [Paenibacillus sp. J23TS9]|uniref:phosphotransferase n=1 Tax=Paenibacillus sp. J23TS9 TaxID=2807193 RepID=UPI002795A42C|nr:phosphotransferase [Paenibacillus sp. J23TS9]
MLDSDEMQLTSWNCKPIGISKEESAVFRVCCYLSNNEKTSACTLILKILKKDSSRDQESHYFYWKREALVYRSGILDQLPRVICAPKCYAVTEKDDGSQWVWLEDIDFEPMQHDWTLTHQRKTARLLGSFNGAYLAGTSLPAENFLCHHWMRSWVEACSAYSRPFEEQQQIWEANGMEWIGRNVMWTSYVSNLTRVNGFLENLELLPRVFAHQDVHWDNIFMKQEDGITSLIAIDWQFASVSGIGEDLGRMFGYALMKNKIPISSLEEYKESLFQSYMQGLREAGWHGDSELVRFGFNVSAGLRFVLGMDKLFTGLERGDINRNVELGHLIEVIQALLGMVDEAWKLIEKIKP